MASKAPSNIDLGFADPFEQPWKSKCKYFPSKIGGSPSFLGLSPVLNADQLTCPKCQSVMKFILQIYAPIESNEKAFHRALFLFGCTQDCSEFAVYRSQLPRDNRFYSKDPPDYDSPIEKDPSDPNPGSFGVKLCSVCGIEGSKLCAQCKNVTYCSRSHQVLDWKNGHKEQCQAEVPAGSKSSGTLFPEYELIIEQNSDEADDEDDEDDDEEVAETEMFKYREFLAAHAPTMQNEKVEEYDQEDEAEQRTFERFKKCTKEGEVVRYRSEWYHPEVDTNPDILPISTRSMPPEVPSCEACQSPRKFEFQVMPHLLNKILDGDSCRRGDNLDWGTLLVYSCSGGCFADGYVREFVHNQPVL